MELNQDSVIFKMETTTIDGKVYYLPKFLARTLRFWWYIHIEITPKKTLDEGPQDI